jgi:hypothetical protein
MTAAAAATQSLPVDAGPWARGRGDGGAVAAPRALRAAAPPLRPARARPAAAAAPAPLCALRAAHAPRRAAAPLRASRADDVQPVPPAPLATSTDEGDLAADAEWIAGMVALWLDEEWTPQVGRRGARAR